MLPTVKRASIHLLAVSFALCIFFDASKHQAFLSSNNPFAEDPYDAVASFAVQYALLISALSLLRTLRPNPATASGSQCRLVAAGQLTGFAAVIVTVASDLVAMVRHPEVWSAREPSRVLLACLALLLLSAGWSALPLVRLFPPIESRSSGRSRWPRLVLPFLGALSVLAIYPEHLRRSLVGALATVVVGALCLFIPLHELATNFAPARSEPAADLADDLSALAESVRRTTMGRARLGTETPALHTSAIWQGLFGPRRRWLTVSLAAALTGAALGAAELLSGGSAPPSKRLLVLVVYVGLEMAAALLAFLLLHRPLRLSSDRTTMETRGVSRPMPAAAGSGGPTPPSI